MAVVENYWTAIAGGSLIGLSAVLLMLFSGRIAGISGIASGLLAKRPSGGRSWRLAFILGLLLGAMALQYWMPHTLPFRPTEPTLLLVVAGFLVGFGAHYGGGCTSGHGVCGMGRLSKRSTTATITFMLTAVVTVYIVRHLVGG